MVAATVALGTLFIVAGIIYQVVTKPNSVPLAKEAGLTVRTGITTLFK